MLGEAPLVSFCTKEKEVVHVITVTAPRFLCHNKYFSKILYFQSDIHLLLIEDVVADIFNGHCMKGLNFITTYWAGTSKTDERLQTLNVGLTIGDC